MPNTKLLTAPEVAHWLGVELDTLYRYARRGEIRGVKVGNLWRFLQADVDRFVESRRNGNGASGTGRDMGTASDHTRAEPGPSLMTELLHSAAVQPSCAVWGGHGRQTFAEIEQLVDRLSSAMVGDGLRSGDRVLVVLPNCIEFIVAMFAVWKCGGILIADSTAIRPASLSHILSDARPSVLIVDRPVAEQLDAMGLSAADLRSVYVKDRTFTLSGLDGAIVRSLDVVLEEPPRGPVVRAPQASPSDVVSITYTSGSTGLPKGVMHTHESWLASARFSRDYPGVTSADRMVVPLPLYHGLAFRQILAYMLAGGTIILASDIYQALKWMREMRPTALLLVPAACGIAVDHFAAVLREAESYLRYIEIGSAAMPPERLAQLGELLPGTSVLLPYGLTEARVGFLERGENGLLNRVSAVATGLTVCIVDAHGEAVSPGETGEIVLKGLGLMKGYWGREESEFEALGRYGFRTGDMGRLDAHGRPEILGRLDDVLKIGGKKVSPQEGEMVLNRHEAVAESAVVAREDPSGIFEHQLHAYVVLKDGKEPVTDQDLLAHCRKHLEPHKVPSRVHFRRCLPKSSVGKILRHAL